MADLNRDEQHHGVTVSASGPTQSRERPPEPFGKYVLMERIGAGGMAEVFHAMVGGPEGFQRSLVIKRMLPQLSQDASFVRMFIDEARLSGLLSHPNLVQIYEFGKVDENFFIAMEYVHGRTLAALTSKLAETNRVAPIAASAEIARQMCAGLYYAHSLQSADGKPLGIVHRDISPPNLMLPFHGGVKILDFGIARVADGLRDSRTQVGMMKGKISYMSPEQLQVGKIDHRSDIFAVGIVLHEMLTGQRLFRSSTDYTSSRMVIELPIPLPSTLNPAVPAALDHVVMRALERNPDARYATAGEMATDLDEVIMENRYSPHEHKKLLHELFPGEVAQGTEIGTSGVISPSQAARLRATGTHEQATNLVSYDQVSSVRTPRGTLSGYAMTKSGPSRSFGPQVEPPATAAGSRRRLVLGAAAVSVLALAIAVPLLIRSKRQAEPIAAPAAPEAAAPPSKPVVQTIHFSLDSNPQDAEVTRIDGGRMLGRTPLTIMLPQSSDVIALRLEKQGYEPVIYKIIPDLDKNVRLDLQRTAVAAPPGPSADQTPARAGHGKKAARAERSPAVAHNVSAAADCLITVGSFPWAELWVDGRDSGQATPAVHLPIPCGAHKLRFKRANLKIDQEVDVTVAAGRELKQNFQLQSSDPDG
jgi:serine/threonine protein kinase